MSKKIKKKELKTHKFLEDMEERNKKFWECAAEGGDILQEVGKGILCLIITIICIPFAIIGACKRELKK